jgi:hypothetical protein
MTTRLHVVRVRRRPALLWWASLAAVMMLAWLLELWLLLLGCAAGTITVIRFRRWHRRTVLPAIIAGAAAARPPGACPTIAMEESATLWLAVLCGGRPQWLRRAIQLVGRMEEDPWAVHVAISRLEAAETTLSQGRILGLAPRRTRLAPEWRVALWGILAVGLLILAHVKGTWWLLPTALALTGASASLTELEQSRVAPRILAEEALRELRCDDGETSPPQLALLAGGDPQVVRRAVWLLETARWDVPRREAALHQLRAAKAMTSEVGSWLFLFSNEKLSW